MPRVSRRKYRQCLELGGLSLILVHAGVRFWDDRATKANKQGEGQAQKVNATLTSSWFSLERVESEAKVRPNQRV